MAPTARSAPLENFEPFARRKNIHLLAHFWCVGLSTKNQKDAHSRDQEDGWQCTEEVSRDSDAMRSEGRRSFVEVGGGRGFEPGARPRAKTGAAVDP